MHYLDVLSALHDLIRPDAYLEIGVRDGASLARSHTASIGIDPAFVITADVVGQKPWLQLHQTESDAFFAAHEPSDALSGRQLDLAFVDGLHVFEQVLRDFANVEGWSHPRGAIVVHDIAPATAQEAARVYGGGDWTGDVWRLVPCLQRHRPDLRLLLVGRDEAPPSGLLVVTDLDPGNETLLRGFDAIVAEALEDPTPYPEQIARYLAATPWISLADALATLSEHDRATSLAATDSRPATAPPEAWSERFDRCVHAFYEGTLDEGLAACEDVLSAADPPLAIRQQTLRNETSYAPTLDALVDRFDHRRIVLDLGPGWFATNPSIAADDDGYLAVVRVLDYEIVGPYEYRLHGPNDTQNTVNHLVRLDPDLRPVATFPLIDATRVEPRHPCRYTGLEDCRLVRWRDRWVASCGTVDRTPSCIGKIDLVHLDPTTGSLHDRVPLSDRDSQRWEKNWMPVVDGDDLLFVYGCDPVSVLRFDPTAGSALPYRDHPAPPLLREVKGGSQGVRTDRGWLFCVHQSADFPDRNRCYLHRFLLLDAAFRPISASGPFTFLHVGVEFCAGLARRGDDLVASFGVEDREAHLVRLSLTEVEALLRPLPGNARIAATSGWGAGRPGGQEAPVVHRVLRIDKGSWHLQGDAAEQIDDASLLLVQPDGTRVSDAVEVSPFTASTGSSTPAGFGARVSVPVDWADTDGLLLRVAWPGGATDVPLPALTVNDRATIEALKEEIDVERPQEAWERMPFLHQSVAPVHGRIVESAAVVHAEVCGELPHAPRASIVVTLHRNLSFLERQIATFAMDPELRACETIVLLDGAAVVDEFLPLVRGLGQRHRLPLLALVANHNAGFSTANNLAAEHARAPFVVLQNSDAFPAAPGWIGRMLDRAADPTVGAIGPKLLYPDGRVQGTGNDYVRLTDLPGWNWQTRHWGVARDDPAVADDAPVRGVGGASLFMPTALYRRIGGLPSCYLTGQFEDCEINDRVRELGYQPWYLASVEMIHVEAQTHLGLVRRREWLHNAWLYAQRQGAFLAAGG